MPLDASVAATRVFGSRGSPRIAVCDTGGGGPPSASARLQHHGTRSSSRTPPARRDLDGVESLPLGISAQCLPARRCSRRAWRARAGSRDLPVRQPPFRDDPGGDAVAVHRQPQSPPAQVNVALALVVRDQEGEMPVMLDLAFNQSFAAAAHRALWPIRARLTIIGFGHEAFVSSYALASPAPPWDPGGLAFSRLKAGSTWRPGCSPAGCTPDDAGSSTAAARWRYVLKLFRDDGRIRMTRLRPGLPDAAGRRRAPTSPRAPGAVEHLHAYLGLKAVAAVAVLGPGASSSAEASPPPCRLRLRDWRARSAVEHCDAPSRGASPTRTSCAWRTSSALRAPRADARALLLGAVRRGTRSAEGVLGHVERARARSSRLFFSGPRRSTPTTAFGGLRTPLLGLLPGVDPHPGAARRRWTPRATATWD